MKKLLLLLLVLTIPLSASACKCSHPDPIVLAYSPPTCTTQGATTFGCNECHGRWVEYTQPTHEFVSAYKEPTCKQKGYTGIGCKNCDYLSVVVSYDTVNHSYEKKNAAPTCSVEGYESEECKWCGHKKSFSVLEKTDHDLIFGENGLVCQTCSFVHRSNCDHSFVLNKIVDPTCTQEGYRLLSCEHCRVKCKTDLVSVIPHDLTLTSESASSCFETGVENYACENCSFTETRIIPPIPHLIIDGECVICNEKSVVYTENATISVTNGTIINIIPPVSGEVIIAISFVKDCDLSAFDLTSENELTVRKSVSGAELRLSFPVEADGLYAVCFSGFTGSAKLTFI